MVNDQSRDLTCMDFGVVTKDNPLPQHKEEEVNITNWSKGQTSHYSGGSSQTSNDSADNWDFAQFQFIMEQKIKTLCE